MRSVFAGLVSWFAPGFGAGLAGRTRVMVAWAVGCALVLLASLLSIWLLPLTKTGVKFAATLVCAWPVRLLAVQPLQVKLTAAV